MGWEQYKCIYCDLRFSTRKGDHVPPQSFFPEPRGFSLIQVPCCSICNGIYSKVDNVVRDYITGEIRNEQHPSVKNHLRQKRERSWDRDRQKRIALAKNISPTPVKLEVNGEIVEGHEMNLNLPEFHAFFHRLARALLWKEFMVRSTGRKCEWHVVDRLEDHDKEKLVEIINTGVFRTLGNNEFQYKGNRVENSDQSIWWVRFYEGTEIVVTLY